jgi:Na+-driven multidrug efflux pump
VRSWLVGHHLIQVGAQLPDFVLPILVTIRLSAVDNAYFYVTWMIAGVFFLVSPAVAQSLFAEGSHDPATISATARSAAKTIAVLLVVPMVVCFFGGRLLLSAFGPGNSAHATRLLQILVIAAIPDAITSIYVSVMRVRGHLGRSATVNIGMALGALGLAWFLLPGLGVAGAGWAWLTAQSGGALIAVVDFRRRRKAALVVKAPSTSSSLAETWKLSPGPSDD